MLFMVIERFRDPQQVGDRFQQHGRMLPPSVTYHASWIESDTGRCFQLMEAPSREALEPWLRAWADLMELEVVPVVTSAEFWQGKQSASA